MRTRLAAQLCPLSHLMFLSDRPGQCQLCDQSAEELWTCEERVLSLFPRIDGHFRGRLTVLISLKRLFQQFFQCKNDSASQAELAEVASTLKPFVNALARHRVGLSIHVDSLVRHPGLVRWHLCRDTFHQHRHWTQAELFQRSQHVLFHWPSGLRRGSATGIVKTEVLLRRDAWLATAGNFHVWSGLLNFVAQMLGTNSAWSCHLHFVVFWGEGLHARSWFQRSRGGMEPRDRLGWWVHVHFLACFHRVPDGSELRFRSFVDCILLIWSGRVPGRGTTWSVFWPEGTGECVLRRSFRHGVLDDVFPRSLWRTTLSWTLSASPLRRLVTWCARCAESHVQSYCAWEKSQCVAAPTWSVFWPVF